VKIRRSVRLPGTRKTWKEGGAVCVLLCREDEVTNYNFEAWLFQFFRNFRPWEMTLLMKSGEDVLPKPRFNLKDYALQ
jgi:hypothetical protein